MSGPKFGDMNVPVAWTQDIASYIKSLAPHKLIVDGTYGVNKTHLAIPEIDIFSDHFYPLNLTKLNADIELVGSADRVYLAGEIDWTETSTKTNVTLRQFYDAIEARQNLTEPVVAGSSFWSLFGRDVPDCSVSFPAGLVWSHHDHFSPRRTRLTLNSDSSITLRFIHCNIITRLIPRNRPHLSVRSESIISR